MIQKSYKCIITYEASDNIIMKKEKTVKAFDFQEANNIISALTSLITMHGSKIKKIIIEESD